MATQVILWMLSVAVPNRETPPLRVVSAGGDGVWQGVLENNKQNRRGNNPVDFSIVAIEDKGQVRIAWQMIYKGPRPPFVIVEPSLNGDHDHTELRVFARGKNGSIHSLHLMAPASKWDLVKAATEGVRPKPVRRSQFLTANKDQPLKGELVVSKQQLLKLFQVEWPDQFHAGSRLLAIELLHMPADRGEQWNLDAWTGWLYSEVVQFKKG
jgi:hypothetical protein